MAWFSGLGSPRCYGDGGIPGGKAVEQGSLAGTQVGDAGSPGGRGIPGGDGTWGVSGIREWNAGPQGDLGLDQNEQSEGINPAVSDQGLQSRGALLDDQLDHRYYQVTQLEDSEAQLYGVEALDQL